MRSFWRWGERRLVLVSSATPRRLAQNISVITSDFEPCPENSPRSWENAYRVVMRPSALGSCAQGALLEKASAPIISTRRGDSRLVLLPNSQLRWYVVSSNPGIDACEHRENDRSGWRGCLEPKSAPATPMIGLDANILDTLSHPRRPGTVGQDLRDPGTPVCGLCQTRSPEMHAMADIRSSEFPMRSEELRRSLSQVCLPTGSSCNLCRLQQLVSDDRSCV